MPDYPLPVDSEDISNLPRIRVTPALPVDLPIDPMTGNPIYADSSQAAVAPDWMQKLTGTGDATERYQTWPEKMLRSGLALPADVYEGRTSVESVTGYPGSVEPSNTQMVPRAIPRMLGMGNFTVPTGESEIRRAQDMAGLAGMSTIGIKPGTASVGSGMIRNEKPNPYITDSYHGSPTELQGGNLLSHYELYKKIDPKYVDEIGIPKEYTFYSAKNSKLADEYSSGHPDNMFTGQERNNITPLKLDTSEYHTFDAKDKKWLDVEYKVISEARKAGKKGVIVKNVIDNPDGIQGANSLTGQPETIYITLDPATVRSRFAKFDSENYGKAGLLLEDSKAATATATVIDSNGKERKLIPIPYDPFRMTPVEGNPFQ